MCMCIHPLTHMGMLQIFVCIRYLCASGLFYSSFMFRGK